MPVRKYRPVRFLRPPWSVKRGHLGCRSHLVGPFSIFCLFVVLSAFPPQWLSSRHAAPFAFSPVSPDYGESERQPQPPPLLVGEDGGVFYRARGFTRRRNPDALAAWTLRARSEWTDGHSNYAGDGKPVYAKATVVKVNTSKSGPAVHRLVSMGHVEFAENLSVAHAASDGDNDVPMESQNFAYILNEPNKCMPSHPFLVLLISSVPAQLDARQAIRETWGNESLVPGIVIKRLFLLGAAPAEAGSLHVQSLLEEESRRHGDLLQQNFVDTYYNLTLKTMMGLHWVSEHCSDVAYVMKTDSDMFVNVEFLVSTVLKPELHQPSLPDYFTGYLMRGYSPNRNPESKWYMPVEVYPGERYPTFCSGTGYVLSGTLAARVYRVSLTIRRLHLEDVYVGLCLAKLRVTPTAPPSEFLFNHWRVSYSACKYSHLVTSHQFSPAELRRYWGHLQQHRSSPCAGRRGKGRNRNIRARRRRQEIPERLPRNAIHIN
ncbi:beta-1,3-galactosyltransferase 2 [Lampetra fluviatilis]